MGLVGTCQSLTSCATRHLLQWDRFKRRKPKIYSGLCLGSRQCDWTDYRLRDPLCHSILCIPSKEISNPSVSPSSTNTADSAADTKIPQLSGQLSGIHPGAFHKCISDSQEVNHQQSDTNTSVIVIMPQTKYSSFPTEELYRKFLKATFIPFYTAFC